MNFLYLLYNEVLYRPLFNALVWLYGVLPVHDLGFAIIVLTTVIRILLAPFLLKAQKTQAALSRLQPEIKRIQETMKNDREAQGRAMMELYRTHKVNPLSGCLTVLIQLPVLIALFSVFQRGLETSELSRLYSFVANPGTLHAISFGFLDLTKGNIYLGIIAALTQFLQTRLTMPLPDSSANSFSKTLAWQTTYILPILIFVWSFKFPSALLLYWTILNILGILQELLVRRFSAHRPKSV